MKAGVSVILTLTAIATYMQQPLAQEYTTGNELSLQWGYLHDLPDTLGVAGAFVGVSRGVLVVAGGSNFGKPLWAGGKKRFLGNIRVLRPNGKNGYSWQDAGVLPRAVSNGSAVTLNAGILCIGGATTDGDIADVLLLRWDEQRETVDIVPYPSLPEGCSYTTAVAVNDRVYVAGGKSSEYPDGMRQFWCLDTGLGHRAAWERLDDLPDKVFNAVLFAQHDGNGNRLYLCSGKCADDYSTAVYTHPIHPDASNGWIEKSPMPHAALAATAVPVDDHQVLLFGGSDGDNIANRLALRDGYHLNKSIITYNAMNDTWALSRRHARRHRCHHRCSLERFAGFPGRGIGQCHADQQSFHVTHHEGQQDIVLCTKSII